ncbi:hypothetical protein ALC57_02203 [Trachymyrmex cornetzi]|uniref:Uncharacterized protein n=1 Tax=Trachymyrmex cornetzi TaxID=471704 RepID=A0A195EK11_9HYME|nr:hypothetical protein ALC57_02203 [Trachymyrmex cornetzi]
MLMELVWREGKENESMKETEGGIREVLGNIEKERGKERKGMGWWGRECREKEGEEKRGREREEESRDYVTSRLGRRSHRRRAARSCLNKGRFFSLGSPRRGSFPIDEPSGSYLGCLRRGSYASGAHEAVSHVAAAET